MSARPNIRTLAVSLNCPFERTYSVRLPRGVQVIMDLDLPAINGLELIALLKNDESLSQIPVIVLSGFVDGMPDHMAAVRRRCSAGPLLCSADALLCSAAALPSPCFAAALPCCPVGFAHLPATTSAFVCGPGVEPPPSAPRVRQALPRLPNAPGPLRAS